MVAPMNGMTMLVREARCAGCGAELELELPETVRLPNEVMTLIERAADAHRAVCPSPATEEAAPPATSAA